MNQDDDIRNLFQQFDGEPEQYKEITRAEHTHSARSRWPLLDAVRTRREPIPPAAVTAPLTHYEVQGAPAAHAPTPAVHEQGEPVFITPNPHKLAAPLPPAEPAPVAWQEAPTPAAMARAPEPPVAVSVPATPPAMAAAIPPPVNETPVVAPEPTPAPVAPTAAAPVAPAVTSAPLTTAAPAAPAPSPAPAATQAAATPLKSLFSRLAATPDGEASQRSPFGSRG